MAHVNTKQGKKITQFFLKKYKNKNTMCRGGGGGSSLFALSDLLHSATVGTVFLAAINSSPSSPPSTDHQLQPSPSTPPPHLQKRKTQAATG